MHKGYIQKFFFIGFFGSCLQEATGGFRGVPSRRYCDFLQLGGILGV